MLASSSCPPDWVFDGAAPGYVVVPSIGFESRCTSTHFGGNWKSSGMGCWSGASGNLSNRCFRRSSDHGTKVPSRLRLPVSWGKPKYSTHGMHTPPDAVHLLLRMDTVHLHQAAIISCKVSETPS